MKYLLLIVFVSCVCLLPAQEFDPQTVELSDVVTLPDRHREYYKVFFTGDNAGMLCTYFNHNKEENKITYAEAGNDIKITKSDAVLKRVEPRITPAELVEQRGEQLLAAHAYERLHLDAQREIMKLLRYGSQDEPIAFGKEEVPAPLKETVDFALKAAVQYPKNHRLQNATADLLIKNNDERLEQYLVSAIKADSKWGEGYAYLASILDEQERDQELFAFVKNWVKRMRGSEAANRWAMRVALRNNDTDTAKRAAQNLWLRNKDTAAGAEYAKILLFEHRGREALKVANDVLALNPNEEEMKIVAGSALLAEKQLDEAEAMLRQVTGSGNQNLQNMARHNLGVLEYLRGDAAEARKLWRGIEHPATRLARSIANRKPVTDKTVLRHPAMSMVVGELNAALALEREQPAEALKQLRPNHSNRHAFLKRVAELIDSNYSKSSISLLNGYPGEESVLWRAYAWLQLGEYARAETLLQNLPKDHGYAAVYRVYCAEGLGDTRRAQQLFEVARQAPDAPAQYISELESHYLTLKSSRELETFDWPAGDVLETGWFSEAPKTGIHVFANGEYLAFSGIQKAEAISRAWRKRSKERLRKIQATIDPAQGWSGLELRDVKGKNGIAVAIELIENEKQLVWRRLSEGKWSSIWTTIAPMAGNRLILILDDSEIGNDQIKIQDESGDLHPIASLSEIPGSHMLVGFFTFAPSQTEVMLKVRELLFEVRPKQ